jgi:hypothetical protein
VEGLNLIIEAARRGMTVRVDGEQLVFRGPAEEGDLVQQMLARKPGLLQLLREFSALQSLDPFTARVIQNFGGLVDEAGEVGPSAPILSGVLERVAAEARTGTCSCCGGRSWWKLVRPEGPWICGTCHPPLVHQRAIAWVEVDA